jgi:hypothetical protein
VTLANGRIGISGSVLFAVNSDQLRPDGRQLLKSLVPPLQVYLGERDEMLMVSGFTDDKPISEGNRRFEDNLELSAQRALTVTRALIEEGMPLAAVFAAAFGAEQPVAANTDEAGRAKNRRVEMAPVVAAAHAHPAGRLPAPLRGACRGPAMAAGHGPAGDGPRAQARAHGPRHRAQYPRKPLGRPGGRLPSYRIAGTMPACSFSGPSTSG